MSEKSRKKIDKKELKKLFEDLKDCERVLIFGRSENKSEEILFAHGLSLIEILGSLEHFKMQAIKNTEKSAFMEFLKEKEELLKKISTASVMEQPLGTM